MRIAGMLLGCVLSIVGTALPRTVAAGTSDSLYSSADLGASNAVPWNPAAPASSARPWESALRFPGRVVSLPFVGLGRVTERSLLYLEQVDVAGQARMASARSRNAGIEAALASLGDRTGVGGELRWAPAGLDRRVLVELNATLKHYSRERVSGFLGPLGGLYTSEWRPAEPYFGPGMTANRSGLSTFASHTQSAKLILAWGWQRIDSARAQPSEPLMFRDGVRVRGPRHRTWVSAWAGPRERAVSRGRDPVASSFEIAHPSEAAASLNRKVEHFTYGAGLSHDARRGRPRWSSGWRASVEAERFDRPLRALALHTASAAARSFTRVTYHGETCASFGRDPRTFRLAVTAVDQRLDTADGTFLLADLQSLGGSAGLAGFESGRFRDSDMAVAKLSYLFPLVKNLECDLHAETGGVYAGLSQARLSAARSTYGAALRVRNGKVTFGAIGCDWSSEAIRPWLTVGRVD